MTALEEATQKYWLAGMLFNQGVGPNISTSDVICLVNNAEDSLGPHRSVKYKLRNLSRKIIQGRSRKKAKAPVPSNILPLVGRQS